MSPKFLHAPAGVGGDSKISRESSPAPGMRPSLDAKAQVVGETGVGVGVGGVGGGCDCRGKTSDDVGVVICTC